MIKTIRTMIEIKMPIGLAVKVLIIGLIENIVNLPKNLILWTLTIIYTILEKINEGIDWVFQKVDLIPELVIRGQIRDTALDFIKNYTKENEKVVKANASVAFNKGE